MLITGAVGLARVLADPMAPSSFGAWLKYAVNQHIGALSLLVADFFLFSGVATLTAVQASQISRNITTNEMANVMRYSYLRGPGGQFRNAYDHGFKKNCSDFLINGYSEDVEYIKESPQLAGEIGMMHMTSNSNLQSGVGHSHQTNGNGCVVVDVNTKLNRGHLHSSNCGHNNLSKADSVPEGLGLGLGRNSPRSVLAS